ncbi:MAG TPA: TolC family protein [Bryobacteraceae bacterium]|nr:TolC family protein [Bryobacteraceae bacterium]
MRNSIPAIVIAASAATVFAQPGAPTKLSLQDAEGMALKNHPEVLAAQNAYSALNQRITEVRSAYFPQLNGEATGSQGNVGARIGAGYITDSRLFDRYGNGVILDQLITDSGRTPNLVASSRLNASAANQTVQATRYDVLLRVNQAYFDTLRAQALVRVADQTVAARQTVYDQINTMFTNKLKSEVDVAFASVELSRAKLMQLQAQQQVQSQFAELTRALGSQDAATYQLADEPLPPSPAQDVENLVQQGLNARPELASLKLSRDAAYKFEHAERDLSLPNVKFIGVGGYMPYVDQITLPRVIPGEYEGGAINVEVPILNGGLFKARREEAHYRAMEADQRLRNEAEQIARDVRSAWANANVAYQRMDVTAEMVRQALLARDLAQQRYQLGLSSIVELTDALLNQTSAEVDNVNAKYDYQNMYAALQYTIGALR